MNVIKYIRKLHYSFSNRRSLCNIRADLKQHDHAIARVVDSQGGESDWVIVNYQNGELYGIPRENLATLSFGYHRLITDLDRIIHYPTTDYCNQYVRKHILDAIERMMYDEELCVFKELRGKTFCVSRDPNHNQHGISVYERTTGHAAFLRWDIMELYQGDWFPDGFDFQPRQKFEYYTWMEPYLRRTHVQPEPKDLEGEEHF